MEIVFFSWKNLVGKKFKVTSYQDFARLYRPTNFLAGCHGSDAKVRAIGVRLKMHFLPENFTFFLLCTHLSPFFTTCTKNIPIENYHVSSQSFISHY
jgi:hypothetical protein